MSKKPQTSNILYALCGIIAVFLSKDFITNIVFNKNTTQSEDSQEKIYAKLAPIQFSRVKRYIRVSGNLTYRGFIKVKPERRGQIVFLNQNQFAKAGDDLVKLESSAEEANLVKFTGALNKAKYQLERARERARQPGVVAESEMKTYESEYQIALGDKKRAESELQKMKIVAPFDGKIGIYNFSLGSYVNESDTLCTYVSYQDMIVDFVLSEIEALNAYPGKKILVSSNLFANKLFQEAVIEKVDPSADLTYGIRVRARIVSGGNIGNELSAGSSVTISISIENDQPVANVPEQAIDERSGTNYLNLATPNDSGSFNIYKTPVEVQSRIDGLAILSLSPQAQSILYVMPEPGINLDGKKVFPKEGSDLGTFANKQDIADVDKNLTKSPSEDIKDIAVESTEAGDSEKVQSNADSSSGSDS